jgi:dihydroorotate dehydrogenase electron transfer subunit
VAVAEAMSCSETALLAVEPVARATLRLVLDAPVLAAAARPGQFVMLGALEPERLDPFLNRPLSIHRTGPAGRLELLVAQVGRATRTMGGWRPGQRVRLLGPLGRGFDPPAGPGPLLLVGGGIGVAPLVFLAERSRAAGADCRLLYGAADAGALVPLDPGCPVELATDDGSRGHPGPVTELLGPRLRAAGPRPAAVCACGPRPMLAAVAGLCAAAGVPAQVSLENRMACGTGACMGCTLEVAGRPQRVCCEGPVFDATEVFG